MGSPRTRRKRATAPDLMALANGYESQLPSYGNIPYDPGRNREAQSNGSSTVSNAPTKDDMEIYISNQSEAEPIHRLDSDMIQDMDLIKDNLLNCLDEVAELREKYYSESLPSEARYIAVLSAALRQWALHCQKNISDDDTILTYVLGDRPNQYQDRELGIDTLEPLHRSVTSFLSHRCGTEKICLYLADMSTVVDKGNGESSDVTMDISLRDITDLDGRPFMKNGIRLNKDSVIQSGSLDERYSQNIDRQNPYPTPSEEVVSIPSSQSPNIYHDRVLLMIPDAYAIEVLKKRACSADLDAWLQGQTRAISSSETGWQGADPGIMTMLVDVCQSQLQRIRSWLKGPGRPNTIYPCTKECLQQSEFLETVVKTIICLHNPVLLRDAITVCPRRISLPLWEDIGRSVDPNHLREYCLGFDLALAQIDSFEARYVVLQSIFSGYLAAPGLGSNMQVFQVWIAGQLQQALDEVRQVDENDGALIVDIATKYSPEFFAHRVIPFVKAHCSYQAFTIQFAISLYDAGVAETLEIEAVDFGLREILLSAIPAIKIRSVSTRTNQHNVVPSSHPADFSAQEQWLVKGERIAYLVRICITMGLRTEEDALLRHMWSTARGASAEALLHVYLPYLKGLHQTLQDLQIPLSTPKLQETFQHIVNLFITVYVGREPTAPPADLTCPPLGCLNERGQRGCRPCVEFDNFLENPYERTLDVKAPGALREHVMARFAGTAHLYSETIPIAHNNNRNGAELDQLAILRITKNLKQEGREERQQRDPRHEAWVERVITANGVLQDITNDEEWKLLLGGKYEACMLLTAVRSEAGGGGSGSGGGDGGEGGRLVVFS